MSTYTDHKGNVKQLKNLGWLLRHWKDVTWIEVQPLPNGAAHLRVALAYCPMGYWGPHYDEFYDTDFASAEVLWYWLQRPVFFGLPLGWGKIGTHVSKNEPMPPLEPLNS